MSKIKNSFTWQAENSAPTTNKGFCWAAWGGYNSITKLKM